MSFFLILYQMHTQYYDFFVVIYELIIPDPAK